LSDSRRSRSGVTITAEAQNTERVQGASEDLRYNCNGYSGNSLNDVSGGGGAALSDGGSGGGLDAGRRGRG
jgi:hypothetical protein